MNKPLPAVAHHSSAPVAAALIMTIGAALLPVPGTAQWMPAGIGPAAVTVADVLATNARASGNSRLAQRHERWTYAVGTQRLTVDVTVLGDDFRTLLQLDGQTYTAGRLDGARWRGDGNGIVHGVEADLQGDALDRAPQAAFALDAGTCTLVGEARLPAPAWVIATHRDGDKPAFLYIDEASGTIVREVMRDGKRVVTTVFDRFEPVDGALRARHWHIDDGDRADALDVTVDAIEPGSVTAAEVAFPKRRTFAPDTPLPASTELPARFDQERIMLDVVIGGKRHAFFLDTGTTSITVNPQLSKRSGGTTLEHAVLPQLQIGPLHLDRVSVLSIPAFDLDGILGLDFFFGHVIEIDYPHQRVRVLSAADADAAFADPRITVLPANVDQGLPLTAAAFGTAQGEAFAIDTGSPRLHVMRPFLTRNAAEVAAHWTRMGMPFTETYLEGSITLQAFSVKRFAFAGTVFGDLYVGVQLPSRERTDLAPPFDGIIGTDVLRNFDLYFDYDNARIGVRLH